MILLSTYMMAIWANCQWIFYRLRPYKNLVNEPLWPYRIAVNSLFCLMAIAYTVNGVAIGHSCVGIVSMNG